LRVTYRNAYTPMQIAKSMLSSSYSAMNLQSMQMKHTRQSVSVSILPLLLLLCCVSSHNHLVQFLQENEHTPSWKFLSLMWFRLVFFMQFTITPSMHKMSFVRMHTASALRNIFILHNAESNLWSIDTIGT